VICPLLLMVLERAIFTYLLYSKDITLYSETDVLSAGGLVPMWDAAARRRFSVLLAISQDEFILLALCRESVDVFKNWSRRRNLRPRAPL